MKAEDGSNQCMMFMKNFVKALLLMIAGLIVWRTLLIVPLALDHAHYESGNHIGYLCIASSFNAFLSGLGFMMACLQIECRLIVKNRA